MERPEANPWADLFKLFVLLLVCTLGIQILMIILAWILGKDLNDIIEVTSDAQGISYFGYLVFAAGSIGTFLLPAYFFQKRNPDRVLFPKANLTNWRLYIAPIMFFLALTPLMNLIAEWNMHMQLPESFTSVERWMRAQEDSAGEIVAQLVMTSDWSRLILNIIVIGFLPAICEEFFFRGALQDIFERIVKNRYVAVWIVAIIFSAIHFQFFGFFPRFILGLVFGYTVLWTGNIWTAVFAHFVNNSTVVLFAFYYAKQGKGYDALMQLDTYPIITYLGSFVFSALVVLIFYRYIKKEAIWKKVG